MKKLILFMLCFPYFVLADSYSSFKNFRVEDSGQVIGGTDIAPRLSSFFSFLQTLII